MFNIGLPELFVVLVIVLITFGPAKLPAISRALGKSVRDFKAASDQVKEEVRHTASLTTPIEKEKL